MTVDELSSAIRTSAFAKFYFKYLRRFPISLWAARRFWQCIKLYYLLLAVFSKKSYSFKRMRSVPASFVLEKVKLCQPEAVKTPPPGVFPAIRADMLVSPHSHYKFPAITSTTLHNATVHNNSNFITIGNSVLHHDLYNFKNDYTPDELHGRCYINLRRRTFLWLTQDTPMEPLPIAASFIDGCAPNYAHWMTEVLPRIAVFCKHAASDSIPIIVNDELHPNLIQSLKMITGNHPILTLPLGRYIQVKKLIVISPSGYVLFEFRKETSRTAAPGVFSPYALTLMRDKLLAAATLPNNSSSHIYIKRNSGIRHLTNINEVETLLTQRGFTTVEPEKLSMEEQISIFHQADVIVCQAGAAVASIIFCKPTARVFLLCITMPSTSYWYWQNIISAIGGCKINYIFGPIASLSANVHSDYSVDIDALDTALSNLT